MDFKIYEEKLCKEILMIVESIITANLKLNIRARARAGAEISDYLEEQFVLYIEQNGHNYLYNAVQSPRGATKNPWDAKCQFYFMNRNEEIWIDFKAFKISSKDSNPDIGTPNKVIKFIKEGNFYLIFVLVYYDEEDDGLKFVKYDNHYSRVYPLKNVNSTFRLNPKPQLQVNIAAEPEYRTRKEFIDLLMKKHEESYQRQQESLQRKVENLNNIHEELIQANNIAESSNENYEKSDKVAEQKNRLLKSPRN